VKFSWVGKEFLRLGITANVMTFLSLVFGIGTVYYLFVNYWLFVMFAILHLCADAIDGVIARVSKETVFGKKFDFAVDQFIVVVIMIKLGWFMQDYYAYVAAGLYGIANVVYYISDFKLPILFTRTVTLVLMGLWILPIKIIVFTIPEATYIITGVASVYSLARQLQYGIVGVWGKKK
jgi:phosphatidylglycerophosphate synthase